MTTYLRTVCHVVTGWVSTRFIDNRTHFFQNSFITTLVLDLHRLQRYYRRIEDKKWHILCHSIYRTCQDKSIKNLERFFTGRREHARQSSLLFPITTWPSYDRLKSRLSLPNLLHDVTSFEGHWRGGPACLPPCCRQLPPFWPQKTLLTRQTDIYYFATYRIWPIQIHTYTLRAPAV